mgnify:CR=1 FL=1
MKRQFLILTLTIVAMLVLTAAPAFADGFRAPVEEVAVTASAYTVQQGDTLFLIASHFGVDLYTLAYVNGIANLNYIQTGWVLNIDAARDPNTINFPVYSAPVNASAYTVQQGDNLFRIALHFGVDLNTLAYVNGIANPRYVTSGQALNIAAAHNPSSRVTAGGVPPRIAAAKSTCSR